MKARMRKEERREQLLRIMRELLASATSRADFTPAKVAEAADVSIVIVYRYVGAEFIAMRSQLPDPGQPTELKLRRENAELRRQLKELKERYKADVRRDFDEAIKHIEELSEENHLLLARVEDLERKVKKGAVVVEVPVSSYLQGSNSEGKPESDKNDNGKS